MKYNIYKDGRLSATVSDKWAEINNLDPGTNYKFTVRAFNGKNEGPPASINVTTKKPSFVRIVGKRVYGTLKGYVLDYPLGVTNLGLEPKGLFGGGNKTEFEFTTEVEGKDTLVYVNNLEFSGQGLKNPNDENQFYWLMGTKGLYVQIK